MSLGSNHLFSSSHTAYDALLAACPTVIFDIGANEGGMIPSFLPVADEVHAFEPVPDMFAKLQSRYGEHPKVILNNVAVSDHNGIEKDMQVHFAWALLPAGSRRDLEVALDYQGKPGFDMKLITLDDYCATSGVLPDFIKLDVDGYEFSVLKGAEKVIRAKRPPMLFEYSFLPTLRGDDVPAMCRFIYELGYKAQSADGIFTAQSPEEMFSYYPEHTSFDILLIPA